MGVGPSNGEHDHESLHSGPFVSSLFPLCLLCLAVALMYVNLRFFSIAAGGKKAAIVPNSLRATAAVRVSQQVTVKCQTAFE